VLSPIEQAACLATAAARRRQGAEHAALVRVDDRRPSSTVLSVIVDFQPLVSAPPSEATSGATSGEPAVRLAGRGDAEVLLFDLG
jgi:hypothetical protein